MWRHEPPAFADYAGPALRICEERRIAVYYAWGLCERGWALCVAGETEKGSVEIVQGVARYDPGASQFILLALQADARLAIGKPEAALVSAAAGTLSEAETAIQQAIAVARRQNAKSWELRDAMSLARLRRQQGRPQEAVALLAPILGWFTEGFDTADLKEAKTLLDKLTEPAIAAEG